VNELVGYFGEPRVEPCGHCSFCLEGVAQQLPAAEPSPGLDALVDRRALDALAAMHPGALAAARQRARFLCGITSPATTRAKLTREELFGTASECRFADALAWCQD
jgi:ATP-dependent DNA helicase RecQ